MSPGQPSVLYRADFTQERDLWLWFLTREQSGSDMPYVFCAVKANSSWPAAFLYFYQCNISWPVSSGRFFSLFHYEVWDPVENLTENLSHPLQSHMHICTHTITWSRAEYLSVLPCNMRDSWFINHFQIKHENKSLQKLSLLETSAWQTTSPAINIYYN